MTKKSIAEVVKAAFFEGFASYASGANAFNTVEEAWENSDAKTTVDRLLSHELR